MVRHSEKLTLFLIEYNPSESNMTLEILNHLDIVEIMENYLITARPNPEIRHKLDIDYDIQGQSVILNEVRPDWKNPEIIRRLSYAKATFVKSKNVWKVFWMRADLKWHKYDPKPTVQQLKDFLKLVDEDKYACFKG